MTVGSGTELATGRLVVEVCCWGSYRVLVRVRPQKRPNRVPPFPGLPIKSLYQQYPAGRSIPLSCKQAVMRPPLQFPPSFRTPAAGQLAQRFLPAQCMVPLTLDVMWKDLCPPTATCFFITLKRLNRQSRRPALCTRRLKSTSSHVNLLKGGEDGTGCSPHPVTPDQACRVCSPYWEYEGEGSVLLCGPYSRGHIRQERMDKL